MHTVLLHSPLGDDLLFYQFKGIEQLSQVPQYTLELLSKKADIEFSQLLGKHMSVELQVPEGCGQEGKRYFDGIVERISYIGMQGRYHHYQVSLQSWLGLLKHTQDYKIFQNKTVIEILQEVFAEAPEAKVEFKTQGHYTPWPYCVQYAETDLNFVLRMMEQEGITFYFTHKQGEHTLVLADNPASHTEFQGYGTIAYQRPGQQQEKGAQAEGITHWQRTEQVKPGQLVLSDYDFTRPHVNLQQLRAQVKPHAMGSMEVFAYPGFYDKEGDGEQFVRHQMEAQALLTCQASGVGKARGLACGHTFELEGFLRPQENRAYLLTGTSILMTQADYEGLEGAAGAGKGSSFDCGFTAIDAKTPFRPQRVTPKPRVPGPQTAVVVGPPDEEIHTDEYGRVKVHFHWDRYGNKDGEDTCWVRVSQVWAGQNFGFQAVPRIGQEVVVDFLEGDPDQPLITGRVYNAEQKVPWDLPANKTQTGVLTRSTSGGHYETANAIRFEDKKGEEEIWFHAEKNYRTEVENSETKTVGAHRSKTIGGNETNHIRKNRTETVDGNESIIIGGDRTETVGMAGEEGQGKGNETITIYGNRTEEVYLDEKISILGNRSEEVYLDEQISVHGKQFVVVSGDQYCTSHSNKTDFVGQRHIVMVEQERINRINGVLRDQIRNDKTVEVGSRYHIEAGDYFQITCGKSVFSMNKDGVVCITADTVLFNAKETVEINGKTVDLNPPVAQPVANPDPKGAAAIRADVEQYFSSTAPAAAQIPDSVKAAVMDALDPATLDPNSPPFIDNPNPQTLQDQWVSMPTAPAPTDSTAPKPTKK